MKILYIALKYDNGDRERGYSFEHYNFYDSLVKMNGGEHQVVYFPFDEILKESGRDEMNRRLLKTVYSEKPALCFFFLFNDEIKKETIGEITEKSGAATFNWFADDHWRFDSFSRHFAPFFHWVGTTDSSAPDKYRHSGYRNVIKTQWACNHFLYKPPTSWVRHSEGTNLSFVGQPHGDRRRIISHLQKQNLRVDTWGRGWPNGRISQEEMIRLFFGSKINLNLTKASGIMNLKSIARIFLSRRSDKKIRLNSPLSWPDHLREFCGHFREQIKGRNFEIPGCGGFLLTSDADNLRDYYADGKEIVIFKDVNDLIMKARYYLSHEAERLAIAKAGYERTIREHTYERRFREIFKIMGLA